MIKKVEESKYIDIKRNVAIRYVLQDTILERFPITGTLIVYIQNHAKIRNADKDLKKYWLDQLTSIMDDGDLEFTNLKMEAQKGKWKEKVLKQMEGIDEKIKEAIQNQEDPTSITNPFNIIHILIAEESIF